MLDESVERLGRDFPSDLRGQHVKKHGLFLLLHVEPFQQQNADRPEHQKRREKRNEASVPEQLPERKASQRQHGDQPDDGETCSEYSAQNQADIAAGRIPAARLKPRLLASLADTRSWCPRAATGRVDHDARRACWRRRSNRIRNLDRSLAVRAVASLPGQVFGHLERLAAMRAGESGKRHGISQRKDKRQICGKPKATEHAFFSPWILLTPRSDRAARKHPQSLIRAWRFWQKRDSKHRGTEETECRVSVSSVPRCFNCPQWGWTQI